MRKTPIYENIGGSLFDWQKDFIRKNAHLLTGTEIAAAIKKSPSLVYDYCAAKGIVLSKRGTEAKKAPVKETKQLYVPRPIVRIQTEPAKKEFVRPPAEYGNRSWDKVIDYYINLKI